MEPRSVVLVERPKVAIAGRRRTGSRWWLRVGLILLVIFWTAPLLYLALLSVTSQGEMLSGRLWPENPYWENWPIAFRTVPLVSFLRNSIVAATLSSLVTVLLSFPLAYAVVRLQVGGGILPTLVLASYAAPPIVAAIPLFFLLRGVGLIDHVFGLILVYGMANVPVAFYLLDNFLLRIPAEIEEAACLDGAGTLRTLVTVVLPLVAPGVVATGIICAILAYNEFLFAVLFTYSPKAQTLPVGLSLYQGERLVQYGQMAVASLVGIAPVYVLGGLLQRWLIGGLTGGIK
ncbi:MAG: carbohydrate ABC transporter permease [Thermomicrobium sp.]|nr:carbohydrate ABC transporter permease [Thermomicrobium sp.]